MLNRSVVAIRSNPTQAIYALGSTSFLWKPKLLFYKRYGCGLFYRTECVRFNLTGSAVACEYMFSSLRLRLEQDVKKLKADLQASRQVEQDLRSQIGSMGSNERSMRTELGQLRQENELLQNKWVTILLLTSGNCKGGLVG